MIPWHVVQETTCREEELEEGFPNNIIPWQWKIELLCSEEEDLEEESVEGPPKEISKVEEDAQFFRAVPVAVSQSDSGVVKSGIENQPCDCTFIHFAIYVF